MYKEIEGNLITLAKEGKFDVIAHGCNCQCIMGSGIAPQMAKAFGCDKFPMERHIYRGDINKLGTIDALGFIKGDLGSKYSDLESFEKGDLIVVNAYTQFDIIGRKIGKPDLSYAALALCLQKMNHIFKGKQIGLPQIGCSLAGGKWNIVKEMIKSNLSDCDVTVVIYKP